MAIQQHAKLVKAAKAVKAVSGAKATVIATVIAVAIVMVKGDCYGNEKGMCIPRGKMQPEM